jgi:GntR family transcriptional regulator
MPMLDTGSAVPLYQQILVILQNKIQTGELAPGDAVPGEQALCDEFGVSRITARRALNELAARGLVDRQRGRGTRVARQPPAQPVRASNDGLLENVGHIGRTTRVQVLRNGTMPAGHEAAAALGLAPNDPVLRAVRVRHLGDMPMSYLVTSVPPDIGARIAGQDMSETPLLLLLEAAGIEVATATQTITATLADPEVATALAVPAGAPLIDVRRSVQDKDGRAVEYIRILYRPELYRLEMTMHRRTEGQARVWRAQDSVVIKGPESP